MDRIAILMPGDMGHGVGRALRRHGHDVLTCLAGRSARTRGLAAAAGMRDAGSLEALVAEAADNCGMTWESLPSGAGHDAQAIASIAPMAMLFVPSVDGISHSPEEYSTPEDCANGAQVLLELLLLADSRF